MEERGMERGKTNKTGSITRETRDVLSWRLNEKSFCCLLFAFVALNSPHKSIV